MDNIESKKGVRFTVYFFVFLTSIFVYGISMMVDMLDIIPLLNGETYGISDKSVVALIVAFGIAVSLFMIYFCLEVMVKGLKKDDSTEVLGKKK